MCSTDIHNNKNDRVKEGRWRQWVLLEAGVSVMQSQMTRSTLKEILVGKDKGRADSIYFGILMQEF
jgi:hypothetical protein